MHHHSHFAPLLVGILAGGIAWLVAHRLKLNQRWAAAPSARLEGFAGWLLLLSSMQWLAVLHLLSDVALSYGQLERQSAASLGPYRHAGLIAAVVVQAFLFAFALWSAILMHRKSRRFPAFFRIEMVLLLIFPVLVALLVTWESEHAASPSALPIGYWIRAALMAPAAGIGFVYSLRSVRFRNTFVR